MMENWPRILLTTVEFEDSGDGTDLTLIWEPFEATDAELAMFADAIPNLENGWGAGMDVIAEILAEF